MGGGGSACALVKLGFFSPGRYSGRAGVWLGLSSLRECVCSGPTRKQWEEHEESSSPSLSKRHVAPVKTSQLSQGVNLKSRL